MVSSRMSNLSNNTQALAPLIGAVVSMLIVFIIAAVLSSVVFEEFGDYGGQPVLKANLDISFVNESTMEFRHLGGDFLEFNSRSVGVFLYVEGKGYLLDASELGVLGAGESKFLGLERSGLPSMEFGPGDEVIIKVIDRDPGTLVLYKELDVPAHVTISS